MKTECKWKLLISFFMISQLGCSLNARIYGLDNQSTNSSNNNITPAPSSPSSPAPEVGSFSYSISQSYYTTQQVFNFSPTATSGIKDYSISPALPAGLVIDSASGTISGTPTVSNESQVYTVSAKDSYGNSISTTVSFETAMYFLVNTVNDTSDANLGNGICADGSGNCSVRAALEEAAAIGTTKLAYIDVPAGNYGVDSAYLAINSRVILKGAGSTLTIFNGSKDGTAIANVLKISDKDVTIDGIAIKNGSFAGSGLLQGVGVSSVAKNLILKNCEISNNNITSASIVSTGVGLYHNSTGSLTVQNCLIQNNTQLNSPLFASGGGLYGVATDILIENSTIASNGFNTATGSSYGGGLYLFASNKSIIKGSTITANQARNQAAGLLISGNIDIIDTTFLENVGAAFIFGKEIYVNSAGTYNFERSLIKSTAGVQMIRADDGVIMNFKNSTFQIGALLGQITNAQFNFDSCTVDTASSGLFVFAGSNTTGKVTFKNSILNTTNIQGPSTNPSFQSFGYNIFSSTPPFATTSTDLLNTDPLLNALASNGGSTQTLSLQVASPARDFIPVASCLPEDQRGQSRLTGVSCDAGAYQH